MVLSGWFRMSVSSVPFLCKEVEKGVSDIFRISERNVEVY